MRASTGTAFGGPALEEGDGSLGVGWACAREDAVRGRLFLCGWQRPGIELPPEGPGTL